MADLLFGLFLVCLAIGVFWATRKLSVGSAAAMGPGYFPLAIAWGALGFGVFFMASLLPMQARPYRCRAGGHSS